MDRMLTGEKSKRRPRNRSRAHSRAGGRKRSSDFERRRRRLAALCCAVSPRCRRENRIAPCRALPGGPEDPFGNVTRIANGNTHTGTNTFSSLVYDTFGDVVEASDQDGNIRSISYNENGDQVGTEFYYYPTDQRPPTQSQLDDPNVTITAADYPASRTFQRTENDLNFSGDVTGSRTYVTEQTLDPATLTYIDGETTIRNESGSQEFDALGRAVRMTDENGRTSESVYDARGFAIETRSESPDEVGNGVWLVSRTVYDSEGRSVYSTGSFPEGTDPSQVTGTHTVYEDGTGRIERTEQLLGVAIDVVTSSLGTRASSLLSAGTVISSSRSFYDENDRVVETENDYGLRSQILYDRDGRVAESRSETVASDGTRSWLVSRTIYDAEGKLIVSTDRFLVPGDTPLGEDPAGGPVPMQITKTIYDSRDRTIATERYAGATVSLTQDASLDHSPSLVLVSGGTLERVSETLYDTGGRVYRTISGRVSLTSLSPTALTQSNALSGYPIYEDGVDRYADAGLSTGIISDTLFDDRGRQYASLGHPLPAADLGLSGTNYDGNLVRIRSETIFNRYGQSDVSRSGLAHVETTNGTFVGVFDDQSVDSRPHHDAFGNVFRSDLIIGGTITYSATTKSTTRSGGTIQSFTLTQFDDENRPVAEMQATAGDIVANWSASEESFVHIASGDRIPTKLYRYDSDDRLVAVELPAVADPNNGSAATRPRYQYTYNERGNQTGVVDPLGHETRFTFTDRGQKSVRTLPLGLGADGMLGTADDSLAYEFSESMFYDDRGRQTLHVSFEGVVTENVYDDFGRMSGMNFYATEADYTAGLIGEHHQYTFDAYGRRSVVTFREPTVLSAGADPLAFPITRTEATIFDARGRVLHDISPEGTLSYEYDVQGRMTYTAIDAVIPVVVDSIGTPADPGTAQRVTSYGYDLFGRLSGVQEDATPSDATDDTQKTSYAFDLLGRKRAQLTFAPGDTDATVATSYLFDSLSRLDVMTDTDGDGNTLASYDYQVRGDGKRTSSTETFWFDENADGIQDIGEVKTSTYDWTYDDAGRLTDEVIDHWDDAFDQTESFTYDLTGNRVSLDRDKGNDGTVDEAITYSYDANDRLLDEVLDIIVDADDTTTTYAYDQTQQISKTVSRTTGSQPVSSQVFTYNLQGRMASVTNEGYDAGVLNSRERTSYEYNSKSFRVELATETDAALDGNFTLSSRTEFLTSSRNHTDYTQTVRETTFDANGNVTKTIDYTFGDDEISQTVTDKNGDTVTHIFGHDGHGSVRVLYDIAETIAQVFTFSAYGQMIAVHNAQAVSVAVSERISSLGYSGETFDAKLGQQYLRARFYNPSNGRFNRLDDFAGNNQDPQSLHKYAYVHADPVQGIDPSGLFGLIGLLSSFAIRAIGDNSYNVGVAVNGARTFATAGRIANYVNKFQKLYRMFDRGYDLYSLANDLWDFLEFDWSEIEAMKQTAMTWWSEIQSDLAGGASSGSGSSSAFRSGGTRSGRFMILKLGIPLAKQRRVKKIMNLARAAGRITFISEKLGETVAGRVAREFGFETADVTMEGRHGLDQLRRHESLGTWMALEAKGGSGQLGYARYGRQMSGTWIDHGLEKILSLSGPSNSDRADLHSHVDQERRVIASVSRFKVNRKGFQITVTSAIHKIGRNETYLKNWPRGT